MAGPSGHSIFTSLSAIFKAPYAPVFSAILCTQALPTLKRQIRLMKGHQIMRILVMVSPSLYIRGPFNVAWYSCSIIMTCRSKKVVYGSGHKREWHRSISYLGLEEDGRV